MESSVKNKIEHYCAYQERCHLDVKNKLNKLGIFGDQLDEYICYLIDENYLSETRYSEAFTRGKYNNNNWGRIKIKMELKLRNISEWNIDNALKQITEEDYENKLYKICEKQIKNVDYNISEVRKKIVRRLTQKGWEMDLIIKCINRLIK
ncbi:MAG: recombinase RecX [Flavobacteriaceae bacterium]|nr:recombinase RecX [Flavobacteriaceae bacterium]|tara:strand:+ start:300 stop:749 length:450 start_codon:yes stop_codon:yes gene_type:complete